MDLHKLAKQFMSTVPDLEEHFNKAGRAVIAVQRHDKDSCAWAEPQDHFLWIKGRTKLRIEQIRLAYLEQYRNIEPSLAVSITMDGNTVLPDEIRLGDLQYFGDGLFTFSALKQEPSDHEQRPGSLIPSYIPEMNHAHPPSLHSPLRPPLRPVNRQLSVPPKESHEEPKPLKRESFSESSSNATHRWNHLDQTYFSHRSAPSAEPKVERLSTPHRPISQEQPASQEFKAREYDDPFAVHDDEVELPTRGQPVRELAQDSMPERLEAGVKASLDVLSQLQTPLEKVNNANAQSWLTQIENLRKEAVKTRTVVGVVGNTGAGKSSVINAMLDEERLVPTNCMRACTAVVTEISYNNSNLDRSKYRAEIEFIQPEEWKKELKVLVEEVFDDNGRLVSEARNPDSPAGIAYAKIRAVYHKYTKEMLSKATVEALMREPKVKSILGTTKRIAEPRSDTFYRKLQLYVDSKEKGTEKLDKNGNKIGNRKREFECWPLIKVVKLYTKADALSTGAVIVDLPGVHDSNAARAAVAEGYMKQCTGLWIVAPITRAVDDKAAKSLLGNTFKRQLKYDGTYSAVTFICSKTDDISRTEAADTLDLGPEMQSIDDQLSQLASQRRSLSKELQTARNEKIDHAATIDDIDDQLEKWEELKDRFDNGDTVYAPSSWVSKKRKRSPKASPAKKKRRQKLHVDDDDDIDYVDLVSEDEFEQDDSIALEPATRTPLSQDEIETKVEELKGVKKEARRARGEIDEQLRQLSGKIKHVKDKEEELDARYSELCIAGRNQYSKSAIQQDFAAGIKELDHENAEEEDPDNFDPDEDIRDYDEVARSLPVFCVSSRAYQQLCGRMQKDNEVAGFTTQEQTEIPQLQAHCKNLTEQGRLANSRRFLNSLNQLLNSLGLWASDDGTGAKLTGQQRDAEKAFLQRKLKDLEKALGKAIADTLDDISETLKEQLFDKFPPAIETAASDAVPTAEGWGAPRDIGGLHFMTYKATVRRQGVYTGASGFRDFNQQLFDPVQKQLATGWEKTFQRRLPHILASFTKSGSKLLTQFHAAIETRFKEKGVGIARLAMLGNSLRGYQAIFNDVAGQVLTQINEGQREINREFTPVIMTCMDPAYELCAEERGTGSFKRMKEHMLRHVYENKSSMFNDACEQVHNSLDALVGRSNEFMLEQLDVVYVGVQRDYLSLIGGANVQHQAALPREERALRRELDELITAADDIFQKVIDSSMEDLGEVYENVVEEVDAEDVDAPESEDEESGVEDNEEDEVSGEGEHNANEELED